MTKTTVSLMAGEGPALPFAQTAYFPEYSYFYDHSNPAHSKNLGPPSNFITFVESGFHSLYGEDMSESSTPDHTKPPNRRRPRSNLNTNVRRGSSSQNPQSRALTGFTPQFSSANVPHSPGSGYVGQYTLPLQPTSSTGHSPAYAVPLPFHEGNIISQNYPTMVPTPANVFSFQQAPRPGGSTVHTPFSGPQSPPIWPAHQVNPAPSPSSPHPNLMPGGQGSSHSPSFVGTGGFPSLNYPSPMSTQYGYPPQIFQGSPMYQYGPPPFSQHYASTSDGEIQGRWVYLPHSAAVPSTQHSQQFDTSTPFHVHYPSYSHPEQAETDNTFLDHPSAERSNPFSSLSHRVTQQHGQSASTNSHHSTPSNNEQVHSPGRQVIRRAYHPNPPASRSEWVMWVGNVPSDATHDELWQFFRPLDVSDGSGPSEREISIFLISRSNCAFINYPTEAELQAAIQRYNGVPLRPNDPRCARLVCRVRRKDDDLKAGVGGQRGMGMHTRWVRDRQGKPAGSADDTANEANGLVRAMSAVSLSSDGEYRSNAPGGPNSSTDSHASTNSSFLSKHFPRRYFILKSLTQHDLDLSVQRGLWATQKHNEGILDQAYRTSQEVFLIFGVNKSGEFYGYARMAGPVRKGGQDVSWMSRSNPSSHQSHTSPLGEETFETTTTRETFLSPSEHRLVGESPLQLDSARSRPDRAQLPVEHNQSAPGFLEDGYRRPTPPPPIVKFSYNSPPYRSRERWDGNTTHGKEGFVLNPDAPIQAMRSKNRPLVSQELLVDEIGSSPPPSDQPLVDQTGINPEVGWGDCFPVEWVSTDKLPFYRTRHLRNPWNHDKEVKVSRDGTELEPQVGQKLLDEWARLAEPLPAHEKRPGSKRSANPRGAAPPVTLDPSARQRK